MALRLVWVWISGPQSLVITTGETSPWLKVTQEALGGACEAIRSLVSNIVLHVLVFHVNVFLQNYKAKRDIFKNTLEARQRQVWILALALHKSWVALFRD